jgi:type III secretory pathway component EscV
MTMRCVDCNKKLNIFSDYKQITINGEKKEICASCYRKREQKEINQLLKTDTGKKQVAAKGRVLSITGVFLVILGVIIGFIAMYFNLSLWILAICIIVFGFISTFKGESLRIKTKNV